MLKSVFKDVLPPHHMRSSVIYNYKGQCEAEYIGRTNQSLEATIVQHMPTNIHHKRCNNFHYLVNSSGSVIAEHLINNLVGAMLFTSNSFPIISSAHSEYHWKILETLYIKPTQPSL